MNLSRRGPVFRLAVLVMAAGATACSGAPERSYEVGGYNAISFLSRARGRVFGTVYLPPRWDSSGKEEYPLLVFLGAGRGDRSVAARTYPADSLNHWITTEAVPPFVIVEVEFVDFAGEAEPWSSERNEALLTSDSRRELRAIAQRRFRAGGSAGITSIQGFSFGARGALHYAFAFPERFASAVADAFVSDYTLDHDKGNALAHLAAIEERGVRIRMSIGSTDEWVTQRNRVASYVMHDYLDSLGIAHEFEVFSGVDHDPGRLSRSARPDGLSNGLYELRFHAEAWEGAQRSP